MRIKANKQQQKDRITTLQVLRVCAKHDNVNRAVAGFSWIQSNSSTDVANIFKKKKKERVD